MNIYSMNRKNCETCYNCGRKKPNCEELVVEVTKAGKKVKKWFCKDCIKEGG